MERTEVEYGNSDFYWIYCVCGFFIMGIKKIDPHFCVGGLWLESFMKCPKEGL